jgi:hypothetical protein
MLSLQNRRRALARLLPVLAGAVVIAGCASADKTNSTAAPETTARAASGGPSRSSGMAGMSMGAGTSTTGARVSVDEIRAVPTQVLGSTTWQGMKITAQAMTAVPFVTYNGTSEQMVKPTSKTSFHLMVMLNDAQTHVAIPYASVWATITKEGKIDFDERRVNFTFRWAPIS